MGSRIDNTRLLTTYPRTMLPLRPQHYEPLGYRICVARFDIGREQHLIVINVYAATQARATANASGTDAFYERLAAAVQSNVGTNNTLVFAGDFNAKIGQWEDAAPESLDGNGLVVTNIVKSW